MPPELDPDWSQDLFRDTSQYHDLLLALNHAAHEIRAMTSAGTVAVDIAFGRLLPDVAAALRAQKAFVARLQSEKPGEGQSGNQPRELRLIAAYPDQQLVGLSLGCTGVVEEVVTAGGPIVKDPLEEAGPLLTGLEPFDAVRAVLVRKTIAGRIYVVGVCNKLKSGDVFLSYDRMALNNVLELIVFGALMGEQRRQELTNIHRISTEISAELHLDELLPIIVGRAAEVFGAQATSLMLWDNEEENLVIAAAEGLSVDYRRRLRIARERVMAQATSDGQFRPVLTRDLAQEPFGQPDLVTREDLRSALSVPLLAGSKLVGVLNIYSKGEIREFGTDQIELAQILANQVAIAIKNAELRERERTSLLATTEAMRVNFDLDSLLPLLVTQTAQLFRAPASLMLWDETREKLVIRAAKGLAPDCCYAIHVSRHQLQTLRNAVGEYASRQEANLAASPFCPAELCTEQVRTLLMVPLVAGGEAIGLLNVYGQGERRSFRSDEVELAQILANQAAIAIQNADLHKRAEEHGEQLEALNGIAVDIARRLKKQDVLQTIVAAATELMDGSGGGVYLWDKERQEFVLESVHGLPQDRFQGWRRPGVGGAIGQVLSEHRTVAIACYRQWTDRLQEFDEYEFEAVVAAPIESPDDFLGVIAVHDTRKGRVFGETDQTLLQRFGTHAAVALENARAYDAEREAKDYRELLLRSSLDAIVATNGTGLVTVFNERAERMLGYVQAEVVNQMQVCELFHDEAESQQIIQRLLAVGKVENQEAHLRTRDGQAIPALVSAVALRNPNGEQEGGVAFMEDLRSLRKVESDLRILLETMRTVAGADDPQKGLETLALNMVQGLDLAFCSILVLDEAGDSLRVGATCMPGSATDPLACQVSAVRIKFDLAKSQEIRFLLDLAGPKFFEEQPPVGGWSIPSHIGRLIGLQAPLQAILIIPLRVGGRGFGLCALGRAPDGSQASFDPDQISLAHSMVSQAAVLIDRAQLFEQVSEEATWLREGLLELGHSLAQLRRREDALQAIATGVKKMLGCDIVTVYAYDPGLGIFPCPAAVAGELREPAQMCGQGPLQRMATLAAILNRDEPHFADDAAQDELLGTAPFLAREAVVSSAAAPLLMADQRVGLLFVNYRQHHVFTKTEQRAFRIVANQGAITIHNTEQYHKLERRAAHRLALHQASKILTAGLGAEGKEVLDQITQQAVEYIQPARGERATWGYIALYDVAGREMCVESIYPPLTASQLQVPPSHRWRLPKKQGRASHVGVAGMAVLAQATQRVIDRAEEARWLALHPATQSAVAVPLRDGKQLLGALCLESVKVAAFDQDDERALEGLAELAVLAIQNARQAEQLARTNTLAILGAWGAELMHEVNPEVGAIRRAVYILLQRADLPSEVQERLRQIDTSAAALGLPLLPERADRLPRPSARVQTALIDQVIHTEIDRLVPSWPHLEFSLDLNCPDVAVGMAEPWLRRMVRHVLNNAILAIPTDDRSPCIRLRTMVKSGMVEVQVEDNGKGVAPDLMPILFRQPVPRGGERLGRGLLLLRFLAEQHGGSARLVWNKPGSGACFGFSVPLAPSPNTKK